MELGTTAQGKGEGDVGTGEARSRRPFWPHTVYVTAEAADDPTTKRVLSRLGHGVRCIELTERGDPLTELGYAESGLTPSERFSVGKRQLMLTRHHGGWIERCPGTSEHVCCNLWTVNPGEGCPLDCTYCYLQSYLQRNPTLKIYTNTWDMLDSIEKEAKNAPDRLFRIGTGEVFDSLVWDELTDHSLELVPFFAASSNLMLELKTKSDWVDNLVALENEHNGKTVVSWSVNAKGITESDELSTAPLEARIRAAARVAAAGYRVGFHFDPLIFFDGFEDAYADTIKLIFSQIRPEQVAWVSISSLRYKPEMQRIMIERFPESTLPFGEQFLAVDGKLRYAQPIRFKLLNFVWSELKAVSAELPVYMCMESAAAWRNIAGGPPSAGSELVEIFSRRGRLPVLKSC